jgi:hypothetical protein
MNDKMIETRFTLQFSRTDPTHLQATEILNRQGRRSKAQYLVNAILHYENCGETPTMQRPAGLDEKIIESVVNRILREKGGNNADKPPNIDSVIKITPPPAVAEADFDDAVESLGQDGLDAIAGALDMFRKK